jgi:type II secretory pathway component PulJ
MQTRSSNRSMPAREQRAFSLLELLTAVSIMVLIIFALYQMFAQTQKAMRGNITQVDVLESGRAAMEMISRELEQMDACGLAQGINLFAGMIPIQPLVQADLNQSSRPLRTNLLQELFFLSQRNNQWQGVGYRVLRAQDGVGTLYRHSATTNRHRLTYTNLMGQFVHAVLATNTATGSLLTNYHRVADGIIHFRVTAFDPEGRRLGYETTNLFSGYQILRLRQNSSAPLAFSTANHVAEANVILRQDPFDPFRRETQFSFCSNALPAYVEVELGVLEPSTLKQYESLFGTAAGQDFLKRQASKVHLFRQRIPIRTASQ